MIVEAVECMECKKLHRIDSEDYFKIVGSIYIGDGGGVLGNGENSQTSIFCINCFVKFISKYQKKVFRDI
ncbi:MAG: hypothetical protein KDH96_04495 [Candidatus Riesia sp.]|nr:hypothetical protein [Candidatus Riesia sp.]